MIPLRNNPQRYRKKNKKLFKNLLTFSNPCGIIITEDKERGIKMFFDDFDTMVTPEEIGFDYSELLAEIEG